SINELSGKRNLNERQRQIRNPNIEIRNKRTNSKSEARNPKQIRMTEIRNRQRLSEWLFRKE
ncbi:MAG: hypothetical protein NTV79_11310, partial [Candidatus Aureabacteria bacterium]|nr:hypothetical protein [Candidatus Auribacterota bacterium]